MCRREQVDEGLHLGAVPVAFVCVPGQQLLGCCQPSLDRAIISAMVSTKGAVKL